mmetsp:Transcript_19689/g.40316  ORF Transcript_19689/g.40316 Transcript_19689/m.40316 type:complete len:83 (-) Transcript_19689:60-308(-)
MMTTMGILLGMGIALAVALWKMINDVLYELIRNCQIVINSRAKVNGNCFNQNCFLRLIGKASLVLGIDPSLQLFRSVGAMLN